MPKICYRYLPNREKKGKGYKNDDDNNKGTVHRESFTFVSKSGFFGLFFFLFLYPRTLSTEIEGEKRASQISPSLPCHEFPDPGRRRRRCSLIN